MPRRNHTTARPQGSKQGESTIKEDALYFLHKAQTLRIEGDHLGAVHAELQAEECTELLRKVRSSWQNRPHLNEWTPNFG